MKEDPRCAGDDAFLETRSSGSRGFVEVEARLSDGRHETVRVDQAPGHPFRELTWEDIAAKFTDCAAQARLDPGKADTGTQHLGSSWRPAPTSMRSWHCCTDGVLGYSSGSFQHLALLQECRQLVIADAILRRDLAGIAAPQRRSWGDFIRTTRALLRGVTAAMPPG